jgi:hypothetical protein
MSTSLADALRTNRYQQYTQHKNNPATTKQSTFPNQSNQNNQFNHASSIENTVGNFTNNTSIETPPLNQGLPQELPAAIKQLITGNDYWILAKSNRYKKLIREGHLEKLLELATMAHSKDNPANWFAKACSKAAWDRTLTYFTKLKEVAETAEIVARRISTSVNKFIYKQIWNGVNVIRWAIAAEEVAHAKPGQSKEKHFSWLCVHEKQILSEVRAQT